MALHAPSKTSACHAVLSDPYLFAVILDNVPLSDRGSLAAASRQLNTLCAAGTPKVWARQFAPASVDFDNCIIEAQRFVRHDHVAHLMQTSRPQPVRVARPLGTFQGKAWRLKAPVFDVYQRDQPAAIRSIQTRLDRVAMQCMQAGLPARGQAPILVFDSVMSGERLRALLIDAQASIDAANRVFTGALLRAVVPLLLVAACLVSHHTGLSQSAFERRSVRQVVEFTFLWACLLSTAACGVKHVALFRLRNEAIRELELLRGALPDAIAYHSGGPLLE